MYRDPGFANGRRVARFDESQLRETADDSKSRGYRHSPRTNSLAPTLPDQQDEHQQEHQPTPDEDERVSKHGLGRGVARPGL